MADTIVVASRDLQVQARLQRATGGAVVFTAPTGFADRLPGTSLLVLDLDSGGRAAIDEAAAWIGSGDAPVRVIGFYSHIDDELRRAAQGAGIEAYPRGRFWRDLAMLLEISDPS
jgi:hypothetical protein